MPSAHPTLFDTQPPLPEGCKYQDNILTPEEEKALIQNIQPLPFKDFEFQGYLGKRRVISFGWRYDFNDRHLQKADDIPQFLLPLRQKAAVFARLAPDAFQHALIIEYRPGAAIGWHRDKPVFDEVAGFSLLSPCRFRFRRKQGESWERAEIQAEPRSIYLLTGPSRTEWEHSIPAVDQLRYSITFRNFREGKKQP